MTGRPGHWDVASCAWVGTEPTHVVPPVPAPSAESAADTDPDADVAADVAAAAEISVG